MHGANPPRITLAIRADWTFILQTRVIRISITLLPLPYRGQPVAGLVDVRDVLTDNLLLCRRRVCVWMKNCQHTLYIYHIYILN